MNKILGGCLAISVVGNLLLAFNGVDGVVEKKAPETVAVVEKAAEPENVSTDDKEWKLMKAKIVSLTGSLAEKNDQLDQLQAKLKEQEEKTNSRHGYSGASYAERMKKLQEENPEEYKKVQERIQKMRERIAKGTSTRSDFFIGLDSENLNEKQRESLKKLQDKMARIDEMNKQGEDATPEEQQELRQEFFMEMRGTRELMDSVRDIAIDSLAKDIGYSGKEAKQFTDYIDYVYEMTSMRSMFGGRGGKRGGK